ncbi:EamA family transporter RarD [Sphingomonas ginkgonis]|uniref:EamA family transporter RarD n=1 Tax=Sphingomonas ginkgonis TaxID=2315330 RepID=A0A3S0EP64_9SPHN|nr:EamA family transporter RarD [Sphingomonas ginkgonis]RST31979.1 EamA family transporter RarD [Sphingomonas ginkgonis]
MNSPGPAPTARSDQRTGVLFGLIAYLLWGLFPIYFKALGAIPPIDIVAHRICWSLLLVLALVAASRSGNRLRAIGRQPRLLFALLLTALLVAVNWLVYVYAVNSGHVLAGSLGYYLNPIANILLGRFALGERLSGRQWAAVAIAAAGILALAVEAGATLWISLVLCVSFSLYGFLRKVLDVDALGGLTIETLWLAPVALGWLLLFGGAHGGETFGRHASTSLMLVGTGIATTVPLLLFTGAARRIPYSTLGMLQFITPTLQFLLAVVLFGERLTTPHAIAFSAIWAAVLIYVAELLRTRQSADPEPPVERKDLTC